ncbi:Protein eyes shut [Nymphon striatum]|nr:Protein eyes shut [Nymphon striatum]
MDTPDITVKWTTTNAPVTLAGIMHSVLMVLQSSICDENVNECLSDPCQNNGTCEDGIDSYKCRCKPGYSGGNCEMDISVCNMTNLVLFGESVMRCLNGGECVDGPGYDYSCICTEGFRGKNCEEDIDECEVLPCNNGGLCVNLINDFQCFCPSGWTGKRCNEQLQFCGMFFNPCQHGGKCIILKPQNPIGNYSARNANGMSIKPKAEEFKITHPQILKA